MNKLGGLSRKYTKIQELRSSNETLLVDAGNSLFNSDKLLTVSPGELARAKTIAQIYAAMGYDAINIGSYDLKAGLSFVQELSILPWVSANYYNSNGQPLFKPFILKSTSDFNIGIIGLSPEVKQQTNDIRYRPWQEVLPLLLAELDEKTDLIVLLSSLPIPENENIAANFPSIRIIFTAVPGMRVLPVQKRNNAILTQTMDRGRYLGYLYLQNPQLPKWQDRASRGNDEKHYRALQYRLQRVEIMLQRQGHISGPKRNQLMKEKEELRFQLDELKSQSEKYEASYFYRNIPILQNIKQSGEIERLLESVKLESEKTRSSNLN